MSSSRPCASATASALVPQREGGRMVVGGGAVAKAGDGGEPGEGAVDQQLRPDHPAHVLGHAGGTDRLQRLGEPLRPLGAGVVELAEHVPAFAVADQVPGAGVGAAPLHQAREQVALPDDRLDAVLDQPVAERGEGLDPASLHERRDGDMVQRRLDGDQGDVEFALERVHGGDGVKPDRRLVIDHEPRGGELGDMLRVGVQHHDVGRELGGGDPADRTSADHENPHGGRSITRLSDMAPGSSG